ncbi:MAG TPA: OsmC family protein [Xanthomonadaceae bacterium]|nr:OsmC family protein [Xanthomonadaceae bacterium]
MAIQRSATAHWEGDLKSGQGRISTPASGLLADTPYGFKTRFGDAKGTNPEELIAAAHAGCFAMALSNALAEAGHAPEAVDARADVSLSMEGGPTISGIRLSVKAKVPGIEAAQFRALADEAKRNCPVSKALSAVPVTLDAELA